MADCLSCLLTVIVPCAITLSCSMCCVGCCCYWSRHCPSPNVMEEDDDDDNTVTNGRGDRNFTGFVTIEQPAKRYDTLKKRMVETFRNGWSSLGRREKSKSASKSVLKIKQVMDNKEWCCVCWEGYDKGSADQLVGQIKKCGHYFHFDCLWTWLETKRTCPLCRESADLTEEDIIGIPLKVLIKDKVLAKAKSEATPPSDSQKVTESQNEVPASSDSSLETETTPPGESITSGDSTPPGESHDSNSADDQDMVDETTARRDESPEQNSPQPVSGAAEDVQSSPPHGLVIREGTDNSGFVPE